MMEPLGFSDVEIGIKCVCPYCNKEIIAICTDYYSSIEESFDGKYCNIELNAACPKCNKYFDVDMRK